MRLFIITLFCFLSFQTSNVAQDPFCHSPGIILSSQWDVDNFHFYFPDCDSIETISITIAGNNITNLEKLSKKKLIVHIGISITDNPSLTSLKGLENVIFMPDGGYILDISRNPLLIDLNGLNSISVPNGHLSITNNENLESLEGLNNLEYVGPLFTIEKNPSLKSLKGLEGIKNLFGDFIIKDNPSLSSLEGIHNIEYIRDISIENNSSLSHLDHLIGLKNFSTIVLNNNTSLASIDGLKNVGANFINRITIRDCSLLTDCAIAPVCELVTNNPDALRLSSNGTGCSSVEEVQDDCIAPPEPPSHDDCAGALQLDFQKDICDHIQYECGYATSSTAINCEQPHWWVDVWYKVTSTQPEFYIEIGILPADSVNMIVYRQCGGLHAFCGAVKPHNSYKIEAPSAHYRIRLSWETSRPDDTMELCAWEPETVSTVERNLSQNFSFFPNPARNEVRIVWDEQPKGESYIELMNISGQVVKREKMKDGIKEYTLMLSPFSGGLYFVRIHHEDGATSTQKLIILD